jgi:serine/threonine protein kinase
MAPEVMCRQNPGPCVDYYAVGIIAYELILNRRPFFCKTRAEIRIEVMNRQVSVPDEEICSPECANFINKVEAIYMQMIQRRVTDRLGYHGVEEVLDHPWLNLSDSENMLFNQKKIKAPFIPSRV